MIWFVFPFLFFSFIASLTTVLSSLLSVKTVAAFLRTMSSDTGTGKPFRWGQRWYGRYDVWFHVWGHRLCPHVCQLSRSADLKIKRSKRLTCFERLVSSTSLAMSVVTWLTSANAKDQKYPRLGHTHDKHYERLKGNIIILMGHLLSPRASLKGSKIAGLFILVNKLNRNLFSLKPYGYHQTPDLIMQMQD